MRTTYDLLGDVRHEMYEALLHLVASRCSEFALVTNPSPLADSGRRVLQRLAPNVLNTSVQTRWPGTELLDSVATITRMRLDEFAVRVLIESSRSLYDWQQPELPEDPSFYRPDGGLFLGTTTHEHDAWFELERAELESVRALLGQDALRLRTAWH